MASLPTIKELRAMQPKDLQKEIAEHSGALTKMRLDVAVGGDKDTAKLRRLRKGIAQMHTVLTEKEAGEAGLKKQPKTSRVSAPKSPKNK